MLGSVLIQWYGGLYHVRGSLIQWYGGLYHDRVLLAQWYGGFLPYLGSFGIMVRKFVPC